MAAHEDIEEAFKKYLELEYKNRRHKVNLKYRKRRQQLIKDSQKVQWKFITFVSLVWFIFAVIVYILKNS